MSREALNQRRPAEIPFYPVTDDSPSLDTECLVIEKDGTVTMAERSDVFEPTGWWDRTSGIRLGPFEYWAPMPISRTDKFTKAMDLLERAEEVLSENPPGDWLRDLYLLRGDHM